jgi:hypothetical protein
MRRSRIRSLQSAIFLCLLLIARLPTTQAKSSALVQSRSKAAAPHHQEQHHTQPQDVLQLVETEIYEEKKWIGAKSRWSDWRGKATEPPPTISPPSGYQFEGDWKIVTSTNRDSLGWEYVWSGQNQPAMRRRLWLRTIVVIPIQPPTSLAASLKERWNFKGFGMAFYKSLIFFKSFGMALQLPILYNLDWWERHPGLPSLSTSVACYFPFMAVSLISGSMNVDFVSWLLGRSFRYALYGVSVVLLAICRLMFLPVALLLYPVRNEIILPDFPLPTIPNTPPVYSLTVQQRLGMSISWRVSTERGYEFRVSYWYVYLPTVMYLYEMFSRNKQPQSGTKLTNWLRRKITSFGLSTGGPIPSKPHYFCTACLQMSGFYFRRPKTSSRSETVAIQTAVKDDDEELIEQSTVKKQRVSSA